jgi:5-methylcytosine-specific restriction endonuclease McrA
MSPVDFTGRVFGRLTVLGEVSRHANGRRQWLCQCVCGKTIITIGHNLQSNDTRSCGCLKIDTLSKPAGVAAKNRIKKAYRQNAKNRGVVWNLSDARFEQVIAETCVYCGAVPTNRTTDTKHPIMYSGIDRVDNTRGYVDDNVVACCIVCNHAKSDMTVAAFEVWANRVVQRFRARSQS